MISGGSVLENLQLATAYVSTFHETLQLMEDGLDVSLVFFNLRKAFHSVPLLPLLQKQISFLSK